LPNKITFLLKDKKGVPLGVNSIFTPRFLKKLDAEAYLRLKNTIRKESAMEAGVIINF